MSNSSDTLIAAGGSSGAPIGDARNGVRQSGEESTSGRVQGNDFIDLLGMFVHTIW